MHKKCKLFNTNWPQKHGPKEVMIIQFSKQILNKKTLKFVNDLITTTICTCTSKKLLPINDKN